MHMNELKYFDIVYIGLGVSTVTHFLKQHNNYHNKKICFIEKGEKFNQSKTIGGFTKKTELPIIKEFNQFECRFQGNSKVYKTQIPYYVIDLDKLFNQFIDATKDCELYFNTQVREISKNQSNFRISTTKNQIEAREFSTPGLHRSVIGNI